MAGTSHSTAAPYPTGDNSTVMIRIGGYVPVAIGVIIVDTFTLPWDCTIVAAEMTYTKLAAQDLEGITLKTVDATALTISTIGNPSEDSVSAALTLHSDIIGTNLVKGNKIQLKADGTEADEEGQISISLHLRPTRG